MRHVIDGRPVDVRIPKSKVWLFAKSGNHWDFFHLKSNALKYKFKCFWHYFEQEPNNPYLGGKIFVGRITESFTEQDLRDYFGKYGEVSYVFIPKKPFRAFSFVTFHNPEVAMEVCEQDHIINGVSVCVSSAKERKEGGKSSDSGYGGGAGYNNSSGGNNSGGGYNNAGGFGNSGGGGGSFSNRGYQGNGQRKDRWGNNKGSGNSKWNGNSNSGGWNDGGSNNISGGGFDPNNVDYSAIAAPIVAAISQQLGIAAAQQTHQTHHY